jgi:hypothetical protein
MSGAWTVVDAASNKSLPIQGTSNSGARVPYFAPAPGNQDPVGKMRISAPQALIDTDFEYGVQPTKWESIALQNNRQSMYYIPQQILAVTSVKGDGSTPVLTIDGSGFGMSVGQSIFVQNTNNQYANGWWYVTAASATQITAQIAVGTSVPNVNQYNAALTYVYAGYFYSSCGIQLSSTSAFTNSTTTITVTTTNPHGLSYGSFIYVRNVTSSSGGGVNGAWVVASVPSANTFTYTVPTAPTGTLTNVADNVTVYARPSGFVEPRTFDGGVAFSAGGAIPDQQLIRQTRRYFRYQSGKGIQFSTGSALKPALFITSLTGSGTTATVTSRYQHNLTAGAKIQVFGADQGVYNGTFTVLASGLTPTQFTYTTLYSVGAATTATGPVIRISPLSWYGSANRVGLFDLQNGMFFEYDGQQLYAVLRNSINQTNGTVSVTQGSTAVTGTGTAFSTQCLPGQYVVIRGQSYRVVTVASDTSMYVTPEYRGATIAGAIMSVTLETRIPQSAWSDPCNGTGPSGYNLDLTRMQMWYIDYSWYGAGVVRYGFRATNGQINYVTQIQNNNVQFEAYMRTGNIAAHYESNGVSPTSYLTSSLSSSTTTTTAAIGTTDVTIPVTSTAALASLGVVKIDSELIYYVGFSGTNLVGCIRGFGGTTAAAHANGATVTPSSIDIVDVSRFPAAGTIKVQAAGQTGAIEYIAYTGNDGSILYGLTRGQTGGAASTTFTYSATAPISASLAAPDTVPSLSHWGSSVIMDGRFDDDKSLIFNYGTTVAVATSSINPVVLMAIRVAPSVDNGQIGTLGNREIINRMQLQLDSLGVVTTGNTYLINLILNGYATAAFGGTGAQPTFTSPIQLANGLTSSLAQIATNVTATTGVTGGESVAAAYCQANGVSTLDLSGVRDLGNSILGGGTNNTVPNVTTTNANFYPDGPDILYVVAQAVSATGGTILCRLSWKEAQA